MIMSPEMSPAPQEAYSHAETMQEREAAQQAARLEAFPRVAEFMANPDSEFAAGPDIRKATGLSHQDITVGLGYGSFSELKQDAAAWKQEQEANAAKEAALAENRAKEQAYQDQMNVHRQKRSEADQKVADLEAGKRPMTYREKLLAGGERGVALLEASRAMSREDAIGSAALQGYSVGHLKAEKTHVHTNPAAEARQSEYATKLKEFDAVVLAAQGKTPKARTSEAPSIWSTPDDTPDFLRVMAPSSSPSELPFFLRDDSAPSVPSRLVGDGSWPAAPSAEAKPTTSVEDVADELFSGTSLSPEAIAKVEQLYDRIAISPDGTLATIQYKEGDREWSEPLSVVVAEKIRKVAHQAREDRARSSVAEAQSGNENDRKNTLAERLSDDRGSIGLPGLQQEVRYHRGHVSPEITRPAGSEIAGTDPRLPVYNPEWAVTLLDEVKRIGDSQKKAKDEGGTFYPQNPKNIQRMMSFASMLKAEGYTDENGETKYVFSTVSGTPLTTERVRKYRLDSIGSEISAIDTKISEIKTAKDLSEKQKAEKIEEYKEKLIKIALEQEKIIDDPEYVGQKLAADVKEWARANGVKHTAFLSQVQHDKKPPVTKRQDPDATMNVPGVSMVGDWRIKRELKQKRKAEKKKK